MTRTERSVVTTLALAFRIKECGEYRYADAQREFGMSLRTYRRVLARLRSAGFMLHSSYVCGNGMGYVRYLGYDYLQAEASNN